ncbi:MAG: hypothetical protein KGJ60_06210 [Verrucomicrobiota bacterium]|nr:hypothetical protein [Verrucomicrobiota bacterium]
MEINASITAALLALGIASQAGAQNVVYLTGSTAFRSTVDAALNTPGVVFDTGTTISYVAYGNANFANANFLVFFGMISNTPTYIDCAWSGSEAGIASASDVTIENTDRNGNPIPLAGSPEKWLDVSAVTLNDSAYSTNPPANLFESTSHGADLAQADTSQAVSLTPAVAGTSTELHDFGSEGVVTFTWCKNAQTSPTHEWNDFTNISIEQAFIALGGPQPVGFFTGNTNDDDMMVYMVGRNKGSGTRANTLSDTGYGTTRNVQQFSVGLGIEEPATGTLILTNESNNGYESGGGVGAALAIPGSCQQTDPFPNAFGGQNPGWIAIGYISPSDAISHGLTIANGNWLGEDGVMESDGAIENGQYSFWGHEHLYGKYGISGYQFTAGNNIFNGVQSYLANVNKWGSDPTAHDPGIAYKYMNCVKSSDVAYPVWSGQLGY